MRVTRREAVMGWTTGLILMSGASFLIVGPWYTEWKGLLDSRVETQNELLDRQADADSIPVLRQEFAELREGLPEHGVDEDVAGTVYPLLEKLAEQNGVKLSSRRIGTEQPERDLFERPISAQWEANHGDLVKFMQELQTRGAHVDMTYIKIQPSRENVEYLKGRFTIHYVYTKVKKK
jgi:hypothetical protein